jgi:low affinity Fe/Cu permease
MDIIKGTLSIPTMTIKSTLGHMDISGTQDMNNEIDYFVRIPMSVLMKATRNKVFGTKENDPEAVDKIITVDANKRTRYLNLNIKGTLDDYAIKIGKDKK